MTAAVKGIGRHESRAKTSTETSDLSWNSLYRLGAIAALITVIFIPIAIIVFIAAPPPTTVIDWFSLFQNNKLVALIDFDLLIVASNVLSIVVLLALYTALRRVNPSLMIIAVAFGFVGIVTYFASNPILSMLSLSSQYATATTDVERSAILAAGQSMLAIYQGTAFWLSNALGGASLLIVAVVMLRSNIFNKATAYIGIVANILGFALFIPNKLGLSLSIISVIGLAIWNVLISWKLFQLGNGKEAIHE